jgi:hypothetical protein
LNITLRNESKILADFDASSEERVSLRKLEEAEDEGASHLQPPKTNHSAASMT